MKKDVYDFDTILRLSKLRERFPCAEDRSVKSAFLSARCNEQLRDDFDYVARCIEGEEPAIVLRRLVRDYICSMLNQS